MVTRPLAAIVLPSSLLMLLLAAGWCYCAIVGSRTVNTVYERTRALCHTIQHGPVDSALKALPGRAQPGDVRSTFALRIERRMGGSFAIREVRCSSYGACEAHVDWSSLEGSKTLQDRFHWWGTSDMSLRGWSSDG